MPAPIWPQISRIVAVPQYNHTYAYNATGNLTSYAGSSYTYGDSAHKHAVTAAFGNSYTYDGNGNQVTRTIGGTLYTFVYDYENRLTEVKQGSSVLASFVYDAEGNRVKGTVGGVNTVYIAGLYEYQGGATTKYYAGHNGIVAMRRSGYASSNGVFYMLSDQLQSISRILNRNSTVATTQHYYPYGGKRPSGAFSTLTTKRFTGQYHEASIPGGEGLSYYNARWYDARLGRFTSADTLVPDPINPQSFNRYMYALGNPIKYSDPSGHVPIETIADLIDIGVSAVELWNEPSWINAGFLAWSIGATFIPYVPGAWTAKMGKQAIRGLRYAGKIDSLKNPLEAKVARELGEAGLDIIGLGDEGVKEVLNIPSNIRGQSKAADILAYSSSGRFYITEVKESLNPQIGDALAQLENTVNALYGEIPGTNAVPDAKIGQLTVAIPKGATLSGNYSVLGDLLVRITQEGTEVVRIKGNVVHIKEFP